MLRHWAATSSSSGFESHILDSPQGSQPIEPRIAPTSETASAPGPKQVPAPSLLSPPTSPPLRPTIMSTLAETSMLSMSTLAPPIASRRQRAVSGALLTAQPSPQNSPVHLATEQSNLLMSEDSQMTTSLSSRRSSGACSQRDAALQPPESREMRDTMLMQSDLEEWSEQGRTETVRLPAVPWKTNVLQGRFTRNSCWCF